MSVNVFFSLLMLKGERQSLSCDSLINAMTHFTYLQGLSLKTLTYLS